MKAFGGTCPMCCGDVAADGSAVCQFCGFAAANYLPVRSPLAIPHWLQATQATIPTAKIIAMPRSTSPRVLAPSSIVSGGLYGRGQWY